MNIAHGHKACTFSINLKVDENLIKHCRNNSLNKYAVINQAIINYLKERK